jgi:hypothetical protein
VRSRQTYIGARRVRGGSREFFRLDPSFADCRATEFVGDDESGQWGPHDRG